MIDAGKFNHQTGTAVATGWPGGHGLGPFAGAAGTRAPTGASTRELGSLTFLGGRPVTTALPGGLVSPSPPPRVSVVSVGGTTSWPPFRPHLQTRPLLGSGPGMSSRGSLGCSFRVGRQTRAALDRVPRSPTAWPGLLLPHLPVPPRSLAGAAAACPGLCRAARASPGIGVTQNIRRTPQGRGVTVSFLSSAQCWAYSRCQHLAQQRKVAFRSPASLAHPQDHPLCRWSASWGPARRTPWPPPCG